MPARKPKARLLLFLLHERNKACKTNREDETYP